MYSNGAIHMLCEMVVRLGPVRRSCLDIGSLVDMTAVRLAAGGFVLIAYPATRGPEDYSMAMAQD